MDRHGCDVRFVPKADIRRFTQSYPSQHWKTSINRSSRDAVGAKVIRTDVRVLSTPGVPGGHPPSKLSDVIAFAMRVVQHSQHHMVAHSLMCLARASDRGRTAPALSVRQPRRCLSGRISLGRQGKAAGWSNAFNGKRVTTGFSDRTISISATVSPCARNKFPARTLSRSSKSSKFGPRTPSPGTSSTKNDDARLQSAADGSDF